MYIDVNMIEKASVGDDANDSLVLLPCNDNSVDGNMKELSNGDVVYDKVAEEGQPIRPGKVYLFYTPGLPLDMCPVRSLKRMDQ